VEVSDGAGEAGGSVETGLAGCVAGGAGGGGLVVGVGAVEDAGEVDLIVEIGEEAGKALS
jgi:hypothetical protein